MKIINLKLPNYVPESAKTIIISNDIMFANAEFFSNTSAEMILLSAIADSIDVIYHEDALFAPVTWLKEQSSELNRDLLSRIRYLVLNDSELVR
jgi:hypothetical protein